MKTKILILGLLLTTSLLFANDVLDSFVATSNSKVITLSWKSTDESAIKTYEIERSSSNQPFTSISTIPAKGYGYNYNFTDETAFLRGEGNGNTQGLGTYKYRLKIISKDNTASYSNTAFVAHNVSGIRRTWGMIKEMFR